MSFKDKNPAIKDLCNSILGVNVEGLIDKKICPTCQKPIGEFKDEPSRKEYGISGMCQNCQDEVFGAPETTEPEVQLSEWTKKLGQQHYSVSGESTTLCGMSMLGNNYAKILTKDEKFLCDDCKDSLVQLGREDEE